MRLYSHRHIVLTIAATAAASILLTLGAQKIFGKNKSVFANPAREETQENEIADNENTLQERNEGEQITQSEPPLPVIKPAREVQVATSNSQYTMDEQENISVYENFNEAVVNITTQVMGVTWFLEPIAEEGGSGSGSIIDARGYVITNVHVIENASKIYISLFDGSQYEGRVVGSDLESDIAVLKFNPPDDVVLKTIQFGDSEKLKVGQKVIAIGNPFGFERTLTTGIVSALGRPIKNSNNVIIRDMIQTDASINPGNSGGPLLDAKGNMIGVNTMIYTSSGSNSGIGFAVPASTARRVVADLLQYGRVRRGTLQASLVQITKPIADYARLDISYGILVSQVDKNGNAEKAGIKGGTMPVRYGNSRSSRVFNLGGDIIVGIDGVQVKTYSDYYSMLESKRPGDSVTITIYRDGRNYDCKVTLAETEGL